MTQFSTIQVIVKKISHPGNKEEVIAFFENDKVQIDHKKDITVITIGKES